MKKLILMMAMAAVCVASCNKVEKVSCADDMAQVTFSVTVPQEILTKAISDGESATELTYAVYRNGAHLSHLDPVAPITMSGKEAIVNIDLVRNVEYVVVFWAQKPSVSYCTFNRTAGTVTVDYAGAANDEARDAFYKAETITVTSASQDQTVYLRRPFAQINFWALKSAYEEAYNLGFTAMTSDFTVNPTVKVPSVLNVLDGSVSDEADVDVAMTAAAIPHLSDQTLFDYNGVKYVRVGMNYVLAAAEENANANLSLGAKFYYNNADVAVSVGDVPYRRNFRTNILGNYFTGDANFKVIILPDYDNDGDGEPDDFIKTI